MLNLILTLQNPFSKNFKTKGMLFCKYYPLTTHKYFEFEFGHFSPYNLCKLQIDLTWKGHDHAGPGFEIEVYGYSLNVYIRDSRHWNYKTGTWNNTSKYVQS